MSELQQAVEQMRNMRESYDQLGAAAEAYNTGKVQLADNLVFKGVQADATETLPELAEKVRDIAQTTTEIDGGEMYGAQLFGDSNPAVSPLWNLYDVLAEMKTRFMGAGQYAALIVCEYYKGYDSLQLQGADAYYTCDGDLYETSMPLHVWHDADNGRMNRWVCFLFATAGVRLDITNTAISPRSMYIGGHIGEIKYFVAGRLTSLVCGVEDTDVLDLFDCNGYTQEWNKTIVLQAGTIKKINISTDIVNYIAKEENATAMLYADANSLKIKAQYIRIYLNNGADFSDLSGYCLIGCTKPIGIEISGGLIKMDTPNNCCVLFGTDYNDCRFIYIYGFIGGSIFTSSYGNPGTKKLEDVLIGQAEYNVNIRQWDPTDILSDQDAKARLIDNIKNHILARVSDATGGTQLVFTVSANMYNEIASETITWNDQTMTLADAFLTKNWLLAGA